MSNPFAGAAAAPATAPAAAQGNPFGGMAQEFAQQAAAPAAQTPQPAPQQAPPAADAFAAPPSTTPEPTAGSISAESRAHATIAAGGDPFGMPSGGGSGSKIADDLGQALLVRPTEFRENITTQHGPANAVQADWIVLTGPEAGQVRESSLVFQTMLVSDLKKILDNPATLFMVGFLTKAEPSPGKSAAFIFATPDEAQVALARQAAAHFGWI